MSLRPAPHVSDVADAVDRFEQLHRLGPADQRTLIDLARHHLDRWDQADRLADRGVPTDAEVRWAAVMFLLGIDPAGESRAVLERAVDHTLALAAIYAKTRKGKNHANH